MMGGVLLSDEIQHHILYILEKKSFSPHIIPKIKGLGESLCCDMCICILQFLIGQIGVGEHKGDSPLHITNNIMGLQNG